MNDRLLLLAAALAIPAIGVAAGAQRSSVETVTVVMVDNRFEPDHITLQAGRPYVLRLENHGKDLHEFTAPAFWRAAVIRDKHQLANGGTDVVVQAGNAVSIALVAPAKGHYDLTCADHDWDGMVGSITVD